ncbi:MAG: hypothetical protein ACUVQ5_01210 [Candidatus Methanomethylicaceae archaeon]
MKVVILDCATAGASGDKIFAAVVSAGGPCLKSEMEKVIGMILQKRVFRFERADSEGGKRVKGCS